MTNRHGIVASVATPVGQTVTESIGLFPAVAGGIPRIHDGKLIGAGGAAGE